MSECLLYYVKEGSTKSVLPSFLPSLRANHNTVFVFFRVGQNGDIQLSGQFILEEHCTFDNKGGTTILCLLHDSSNVFIL